jgi:hypothetical protein
MSDTKLNIKVRIKDLQSINDVIEIIKQLNVFYDTKKKYKIYLA